MLRPALMWLKRLSRYRALAQPDERDVASHHDCDDAPWARKLWRRMRRPGGVGKGADKKGAGKKVFWIWIAYQSIKGVITLSLIWIPLFLLWLQSR